MTQPLGDAVLDLTADLGPLAARLAEAKQLTRTALDDMGGRVDRFGTRTVSAGDNLRARFLLPLKARFDDLTASVTATGGAVDRLASHLGAVESAMQGTADSARRMAATVALAFHEIQAGADETARKVTAASAAEKLAIDSVTKAYLEQAAAARLAAGAASEMGGNAARVPNLDATSGYRQISVPYRAESRQASGFGLWGSRGSSAPGSINNPVVVALESGQYAGLGARAAAIGTEATQGPAADVATGSDIRSLISAVQQRSMEGPVASPVATQALANAIQKASSISGPEQIITAVNALADRQRQMVLQVLSRPMAGGSQLADQPGGTPLVSRDPVTGRFIRLPSPAYSDIKSAVQQSFDDVLAQEAAAIQQRVARLATANAQIGQQGQLFNPGMRRDPVTGRFLPDYPPPQGGGPESIVYVPVGGGGGRFGGGPPPTTFAPMPGGGNQGPQGAPGFWSWLLGGMTGATASRLVTGRAGWNWGAGRLGWGGWGIPLFGAGIGSLGSFAGLGPEHLIMTGIGLAGNAAGAALGAGTLALGAAGQMAVGGGSNAAVLKSTISDTQTLSQAMTQQTTAIQNATQAHQAYLHAVSQYGRNSLQAQQALSQWNTAASNAATSTQNLNQQIQALGGPTAGVRAEMGLARATQALNTFWDKQTSQARVAAVHILSQVVTLGHDYVPRVASAALQNLTIINQAIKPLFSWLEGPQGIQIWNNLEDNFKRTLPTAVDAFTNAIEVLLRFTSLASNSTGGFIVQLDHFFQKLNSQPNSTYEYYINRLVGDFRLWEQFVKALVVDIALLFKQDAGTGASIVATLTEMLNKLGAWERSTRGSTQLHTIFEVHKQEVLALLRLLPALTGGFTDIYLHLAPPLTRAFTTILELISGVVNGLSKISPLFADAFAGAFILHRMSILGATLSGIRGSLSAISTLLRGGSLATALESFAGRGGAAAAAQGAGAAAGGAAGAAETGAGAAGGGLLAKFLGSGARLGSAVESGGLGLGGLLEGLGAGGAASAVVGAAAAVAPIAAAAIPIILAGAAGAGLIALFHKLVGGPDTVGVGSHTATFTPTGGLVVPGQRSVISGGGRSSVLRSAPGAPRGMTSDTLQVTGNLAQFSQSQLQQMLHAASEARSVIYNNQSVYKDVFLQMIRAAWELKKNFNDSFNQAWLAVHKFYRDTGRDLSSLKDDFDSNMRLISSTIGLNTALGRQLAAQNIRKMVQALQQGMADGKISVKQGLDELNRVLHQGTSQGLIDWRTQWSDTVQTLDQLYAKHKISTKAYTDDLKDIEHTAALAIKKDTTSQYQQMFDNLQQQYHRGIITHQQFLTGIHQAQQAANTQAKADMSAFAAAMIDPISAVTKQGGQGIADLIKSINSALKLLGAPQLSGLQISVLNTNAASLQQVQANPGGGGQLHGATGMKVNAPTYVVGEEAPQHPEYVLATNPAYRTRNVSLWAQAGHDLGIQGFRSGGYINPIPGFTIGRTDMGVDANAAPGSPILAFGPSRLVDVIGNWYRGQPFLDFQLLGGPDAGKYWYVAEQIIPTTEKLGAMFAQGQVVARYAPSGTGIEIGWAGGPSGQTLAQATSGYSEGQATAAGRAFRSFLSGAPGGLAVPGGGAFSVPTITAPHVRGHGPYAAMVQAGLNRIAGRANKYLSKFAPVGGFGGSTAGLSGNLISIVHQLSSRFGWGGGQVQDWLNVIGRESGGSMTATNPSSGAYGIAQFINGPGEYAQYGGNVNTMAGQLLAMANYIRSRYGSPANAWEHELTAGWYRTGGKVDWGGNFRNGGMVTAHRPTVAMFGENGPETAVFMPHYQTGGRFSNQYQWINNPTAQQWQTINARSRARQATSGGGGSVRTAVHDLIDFLTLLGHTVGVLHGTAALFHSEHLPAGGPLNLLGPGINRVSSRGFSAILSALNRYMNHVTPAQALSLANRATAALGHSQYEREWNALRRAQGNLEHVDKEITALRSDHRDRGKDAKQDRLQLLRLHQDAAKDRKSIVSLTHRIADNNQVKIANALIQHALTGTTNTVNQMTTQFGNYSTTASALMGLRPGTNLAGMGLSGTDLQAMGVNPAAAANLVGGGPQAYQQEAWDYQYQASAYAQQSANLKQEYADALKTHNQTLQNAILGELNTVDQALVQATAQGQQALVQAIQATAQQFSDQSSQIGGSLSVLQGIQGLTGGENLGSLGLSPQILATLGISDAAGAQAQVGGSLSNFQNLAQQQGGKLSPAQLAQAQAAVSSQNYYLQQQEQPLEQELSYYQTQLPNLTGSDRTTAINAMQGLAQQILSLQGTIDQNNSSLQNLTQATNNNTNATNQMTGTVTYSYQGQNYLASETSLNVGVGM